MTTKGWLHPDRLEACAESGCPSCQVSLRVVRRYLDNMIHEGVNDSRVRAALRDAHGTCSAHVSLLTNERGVALSTAIIQHDVSKTVLETIDVASRRQRVRQTTEAILRRLRPTAECLGCLYQRKDEGFGKEADSWLRATGIVSAQRGVR